MVAAPNLENYDSVQYWPKEDTKNFATTYSTPFLSVLHQNKALIKFLQKGAASDRQTYERSRLAPGLSIGKYPLNIGNN